MATTARVALTREHRDAIRKEIDSIFTEGSDLPLGLRNGRHDVDSRRWARDYADRLLASVRLLDQLGWREDGNSERYEIEVDADLARFMERLETHSLAALEEDRIIMSDTVEAYNSREDFEDVQRSRRRWLDVDLDALDAARLAQSAYREALA